MVPGFYGFCVGGVLSPPPSSPSLSCLPAEVCVLISSLDAFDTLSRLTRLIFRVSLFFFVPHIFSTFFFVFLFCYSALSFLKVERKDLESEVGITAAIPQLKIMKQIKKHFPEGV